MSSNLGNINIVASLVKQSASTNQTKPKMEEEKSSKFHITMFPWFAFGHMTPFLHLSNILAERGHTISFLLPKKAQTQLESYNLHPDLITFHTLTVPHVDGLPPGTETASDIPIQLTRHLVTAMDLTRNQVESFIKAQKPDFVFFDFSHWIPEITSSIDGVKSVHYTVVCAASIAIALVPARQVLTEDELAVPPPGYPSSKVVLRRHEAHHLSFLSFEFGSGVTFYERNTAAFRNADAISIRTCREIEGQLCDYIGIQYNKPVYLTGPVLPESDSTTKLEDRWDKWLAGFEPGSVLFCAFGSQFILEKDQFQELLLGFEMTGLPFFITLKPPLGTSTVEEAFPDGFEDRVCGRGVVHGGWVQQPLILSHPSIGCFVNHCGFGSMWESLMSDCQIVLVPQLGDQILNTRLLVEELKVGVEVEREKNGWFSKENLCKSIKSVMDKDSEVGCLVKKNHAKWKEVLVSQGFMSGYIDKFVQNLEDLKKMP